MDNTKLIEQIKAVSTPEEVAAISVQIRAMPGNMSPEVQQALLDKLADMNAQSKALREETMSILKVNGVEYPLTDWLTPANYARKFELKNSMVVTNWIARGIIPAENVKEIPELGIRLVKAIEYNPRAYNQAGEEKDA